MRPVVCGFASSLGDAKDIVPNAADGLSEAACAILQATGLRHYRQADDIEPHVAAVIADSLARSDISAAQIDCVLIATKRDYPGAEAMGRNVQDVLVAAGIAHATIIGLDRIACANSLLAMCMASMLVAQGSFSNCLVLSYNKMRPGEPRLMKPTVGYLSEGAAACVVTARDRPGYHIGSPCVQSDLMMNNDSAQDNLLGTFKAIGENVRALGRRFYAARGSSPGDYGCAILNNLSFSTMRLFSGQLDLPWSMVYKDQVAATSHLSGCDVIVNLEQIDAHGREALDGRALIFSNSAIDWVITDLVRA
jgi:3-oxoacyl-[acyl-carrier-protein] synthase III